MRSHEERVAAVRQRIIEAEHQKKLHHSQIITACSAAACLILIITLYVLMPGVISQITTDNYTGFASTASIFSSSESIGYIIIGVLSFLLGVCVTILCFRLSRSQQNNKKEENNNAGNH